jgi:predicted lipid-binding transport protein (Tim44 family)
MGETAPSENRLIRHRILGGVLGALWGTLVGGVIAGLIAVFHPNGVQHVWEALGIMAAAGAISGVVQWWNHESV